MSAKSNVSGHEVFYDHNEGFWKYCDNNKIVKLRHEDIPESYKDRCSGDGHERYVDENGDRRYSDNNVKIDDMEYRPCAKCGKYPNENGDDFCIQGLGNVINACCGHGKNKGYIQFDNGYIIRGYFEIEKWK